MYAHCTGELFLITKGTSGRENTFMAAKCIAKTAQLLALLTLR